VVRGGTDAARAFANRLALTPIATSLGGVETILELPYDLDFAADESPAGAVLGGSIRMSVGLEDVADLWADIDQAISQHPSSVGAIAQ
jgi:cystathionine beta-lyase/cystathionine gamma-synthase